MTQIDVTFPATAANERAIGARLYSQFLGPWGRMSVVLAFVGPWLTGAVLVHLFTDLNMLRIEVVASILLLYLSVLCWTLWTARLARRSDIIVDASPIRQRELTWHLSQSGIEGNPQRWGWSDITQVEQFDKQTVLAFSLRRVIAIPDSALPDDLTPHRFAEQITIWRDAAKAKG